MLYGLDILDSWWAFCSYSMKDFKEVMRSILRASAAAKSSVDLSCLPVPKAKLTVLATLIRFGLD